MTDRLALPRRYRDQFEALLRKHVPGVEVWAYGSRVNGESHDGSDLDLALRGPALEPLDGGFYDLLEAIEKSSIPILVQAHDWAMLPESFHREIERDYVVLQEGAKHTTAGKWRIALWGDCLQRWNMVSRYVTTITPRESTRYMERMDKSAGTVSRSVLMQVSLLGARGPIGASTTRPIPSS